MDKSEWATCQVLGPQTWLAALGPDVVYPDRAATYGTECCGNPQDLTASLQHASYKSSTGIKACGEMYHLHVRGLLCIIIDS